MEEWLTVAEIAEKTKMPETSVRRYIKLFKEYLPGKQFGRAWKYIPDVVQIIERISSSYQSGQSTQEVFQMLQQNFPQVVDVEEKNRHITTTQPPQHHMAEIVAVQVEVLKQVAGILNRGVNQEQKIDALSDEVQTLSDEVIFVKRKLEGERVRAGQEKEIMARLEQIEKEQRENRVDIAQKDKVIADQQAKIEEQERELVYQKAENERLRAEVEKLKKPWWKKISQRERS